MVPADAQGDPAISPQVVTTETESTGTESTGTLLQEILDHPQQWAETAGAGDTSGDASRSTLREFLAAKRVGDALKCWLGESWESNPIYDSSDAVATRLTADIAAIDGLLNDQVNAILHHSCFQALESSWRGLAFLARRADLEGDPMILVRMLSVTWSELEKDFERTVEFDQSQIFKKIYEQEFGMAGGQPFGMMIGDYQIRSRRTSGYKHDDVSILRSLSGVAAAAFCPFLCAASPELLDLESFRDLQVTRDHAGRMRHQDYLKWNTLRESSDSRFLGVLLPRILMRGPYSDDGSRIDRFLFREEVGHPNGCGYLWGSPAYAYAAVAMRSFASSGWLADIRGLRQDEDGGGLVSDLPSLSFPTDSVAVIPRSVTEISITDKLERQLSEIGLLPLCDCKDTPMAVFASGQTLQKPKSYSDSDAAANAKISAMLPYILTVSRFAHYLKVIARDKIGSFQGHEDIERILHDWIMDYVTADREASVETKSSRPLSKADISVRPDPSRPGSLRCIMRLAPHYELDEMDGAVHLTTTLMSG